MRITAELSLYPLQNDYIAVIKTFIEELNKIEGLEVFTSTTATQIRGEFSVVMDAIKGCTEKSFSLFKQQVLVVKYLNADLQLGEYKEG